MLYIVVVRCSTIQRGVLRLIAILRAIEPAHTSRKIADLAFEKEASNSDHGQSGPRINKSQLVASQSVRESEQRMQATILDQLELSAVCAR